jgi:prolyl oligopeptidase
MVTNRRAPNYRIIAVDLENPTEGNWTAIVEESPNEVLEWAFRIDNDKLMVCCIKDVRHVLKLVKLEDGAVLNSLELGIGAITGRSGKRFLSEMFFKFETFVTPGKILRLDVTNQDFKPQVFREAHHPVFDSNGFETHQVFCKSKDGTKFPMFLVYRKGLPLTGKHFCCLYGYGGFNVAKMPTFFAPRIAMLEMFDGVFALANIRGGGEYGNSWCEAGTQFNKQNSFDDFQAAAEYLIENKYTCPSKLAIQGGSNGGLLVAACINQRPDLFGAAIIQVGVLDMLRFHKFTVGYGWTSDYGCPDEKEHFENLKKYSPLHNIKIPTDESEQYPATLLLTADHDDRVVPSHSYKFISELQYKLGKYSKQTNPLMLRVQTNVGHGLGKSLSKVIDEYADIISFLFQSLDVSFKVQLH